MYRIASKLASSIGSSTTKKLGRYVIIEKSSKNPKATKGLVTFATSISFQDKDGATNTAAGDGTRCATVLSQAIFIEACKSIAAGVDAMDLRSGINMAIDAIVTDLKSKALMISTPEEITQVATFSANGEREIGQLIARAMGRVGKEGVITVADGKTLDNELEVVEGMKLASGFISPYELEVVEGMKLASGFISPYFITNQKTLTCELENPLILIHEKKILDVTSLMNIVDLAARDENRPVLLVLAEDVDSTPLSVLIHKQLHGKVEVCAIKAPGFGENRRANLEDLAVLTGGEVISDDRDLTLKKVQLETLGTAKKVTVSIDDTIILNGGGDKKLIEERCEELRTTMEKSTAVIDKEKAQERLSNLSGGVAVCKVGGTSEAEVEERKARVTDALNATKAAVEEGILPGGGVALLYATRALKNIQTQNEDQRRGVEIIQNALKAPAFTIVQNAGFDGSLVLGKLLEQDGHRMGYDVAKGEYVDMVEAGIIDPLKVVRTSLVNAAAHRCQIWNFV